ncbi:unnamed protein product, partial [Ectocarpus fasciculatus]
MSFQAGDELGVSSPSAAPSHEHGLHLHDLAAPASSAAPATAAAVAAAEVLHSYPTSTALLPPVLPALSTDISPVEEEEVEPPPASSAAAAAAAHASAALFLGPLAAEEEGTAVHASGFATAVHSSALSTMP